MIDRQGTSVRYFGGSQRVTVRAPDIAGRPDHAGKVEIVDDRKTCASRDLVASDACNTIGGGGEGGNWHSRNEWYKSANAWYGPQNVLLTVLMLTGLDGVTGLALKVRQGPK